MLKMIRKTQAQKVIKFVRNLLFGVLFGLILVLTISVISTRVSGGEPQLFGYQLKTVLSGSMEPTFETGSLIVVKKVLQNEALQVGDIITFRKDEQNLVTHRIIEELKTGTATSYVTKGDNVEDADPTPVLADNIVAIYTGLTIPYAGFLLSFASSKIGTGLLLLIPGILLLIYAAFTIWQVLKEIDGKTHSDNKASL